MSEEIKDEKVYLIYDNGGHPYRVHISSSNISVIFREYNTDLHEYIDDKNILDIEYENVFIGDNDNNISYYPKKGEFPGNSILVHVKENKYIFIGYKVYSFEVPKYDRIIKYYSPLGNNDVPYPYAVSFYDTYFMLDCKTLKNGFITEEDGYRQFYGFHLEDKKKRKRWDKNKEEFSVEMIHDTTF